MGVAAYRRGSALISLHHAREAYAAGITNHNPDAAPYQPRPRPPAWGEKAAAKALDHARRILSGCRRHGLECDESILTGAVVMRANVAEATARTAAQAALLE